MRDCLQCKRNAAYSRGVKLSASAVCTSHIPLIDLAADQIELKKAPMCGLSEGLIQRITFTWGATCYWARWRTLSVHSLTRTPFNL